LDIDLAEKIKRRDLSFGTTPFFIAGSIMALTVAHILQVLERIAPSELAEQWDNIGLQLGKRDRQVKTVWVALDPLPEVISAACKASVDILVTHHPLLFHPVKSLDFDTPLGRIFEMATQHKLAIVSAHTNLDTTSGGVNDVLAAKIGLKNPGLLGDSRMSFDTRTHSGLGRIGEIEKGTDLVRFARTVKRKLNLNSIRVVGDPELAVYTVAVCTGSGSSLLDAFFSTNAQVFITGDIRYHDARQAEAMNRGLIDIGHFDSEAIIKEVLAERIRSGLQEMGEAICVDICRLEKNPFMII